MKQDNPLITMMALEAILRPLIPEGGYGGIDMCIKCKEIGADKYVDGNEIEVNVCDYCLNNETAVKWDG